MAWQPPAQAGLYDPQVAHDACGVGFIANVNGTRSHEIVALAVRAIGNLTHRGAVNADPMTGDGVGLTIQIPFELLEEYAARFDRSLEHSDDLVVAMTFLPSPEADRPAARAILEEAADSCGLEVIGWRVVPTDPSVLGASALESLPGIEQLLMVRPPGLERDDFQRAIYLARRRAERAYRERALDCYIVSMSARTVVYKGLMVAHQLDRFYADLKDARAVSALALFHQRFATNTLPNWKLAQPFRYLAHNGEINTLVGNRNWMKARDRELTAPGWDDQLAELAPSITDSGSDSASLDEALDLLVNSGRDPLHAMMMLIPEAWENMPDIDPELRGFYEYHACLTEPWDGPAAVAFTDGVVAAAALDRNGLRPARYQVTRQGMVVMASEVGLLGLPIEDIVESGRLGPGEMIAVDTDRGLILRNDAIKRRFAARRPYADWVQRGLVHLEPGLGHVDGRLRSEPAADVETRQVLHGYTKEEMQYVIKPMVRAGKEPVGSMGDDTPPSALQDAPRLLYTYFRQQFAQVTNPPIDSLREKIVMSLDTYLGRQHSLLEEGPEAARLIHLASPLLLDEELARLRELRVDALKLTTLHARFPAAAGPRGLRAGLDELAAAADRAVDQGRTVLVISDRSTDAEWAPIPMLLAIATVHHHLIRSGRRMRASLIAETGDARDVHHFGCLIGFGASAVNPYLAFETLRALHAGGEFDEDGFDDVLGRYQQAIDAGILKIMSKMGISAVSSYHGAQIFEALGVRDELIEYAFPGTTSRIGGVGFEDVGRDVLARHAEAYPVAQLDPGGWYKYRRDGDYHANEPPVWRALHKVAQGGGEEEYRQYVETVQQRPPAALRDLLEFHSDRDPIPVEQVEDIDAIVQRFQTGAMSLGALGPEAHEDIARAMNLLGGRSNTGEGGEDPRRFLPDGDKRDANSQVKQVASGRFGVTPAYLAGAAEVEIKIAQGSKPGEGGQLPGHKVSPYIASLRHSTPGVELISPPPHHDIYSIEDLAQLIYDLKMTNPRLKVCVKLVACEGVGTIAAGVAKAYADIIQISGADGGTGASPLSSIKYAGAPWELGVKEAHEALIWNGLRGRVLLRTDGGFHTGHDVVMAALLGAEQYGFGTTSMIAVGCKMARQCHLNTCPVGVATQREDLRKKYFGKPEWLVNFLLHVGQEVRLILAGLGYESLDDVVGRSDLLRQLPPIEGSRSAAIDLSRMIARVDPEGRHPRHRMQDRNDRDDDPLEDRILHDLAPALAQGASIQREYQIHNQDRSIGARISGHLAQRYGDHGLPHGTIELRFRGSAGQSFGAFLLRGVRLHLLGEANDYVGKGMGGGLISIRAPDEAGFLHDGGVLVGNTVLYGATGGSLFVAGRAGERFGVRNSGARAVVEAVGDHGCEYMTGGRVAIIGPTGRNFAAGMSGGIAYVLDEAGDFERRCNPDMVDLEPLVDHHDRATVYELLKSHAHFTASPRARKILNNWETYVSQFVKVMPRDYRRALEEEAAQKLATVAELE